MASASSYQNLTTSQVLNKFSAGPQSGLFADGCAQPNPGPGGWGVVWVREGNIISQNYGKDPDTTNNRMELTAIINAYKLLPLDAEETIHTDSNLCVQTINQWAHSWKARGWKRKDGVIANLELVKEAYALSLDHPKVKLIWIKAHCGNKWNEYADSLANAWAREEL